MGRKNTFYAAIGKNGYAVYQTYNCVESNGRKYLGAKMKCKAFRSFDDACWWCLEQFVNLYPGYFQINILPFPSRLNEITFKKDIERKRINTNATYQCDPLPLIEFLYPEKHSYRT